MKAQVDFKSALSLLKNGKVVALPTETVYGLAGRIDRKKTLEKIFRLKKRPLFDPLIVHCFDKQQALKYLKKNFLIEKLFDHFSPGPLTVVVQKNKKISSLITAGNPTVALRIPQHPLIRKILKQLPVPLAAPSANLYGQVSPVRAQHVLSSFNRKVPVLNGGPCKKGLESTIVYPDLLKKKIFIFRLGIVTKENIEVFLEKYKLNFTVENKKNPFQPGGGKSHYKPKAPLYILETQKNNKAMKNFLLKKFPNKNLRKLELESSPFKTARTLYYKLRQLSNKKESLIFAKKQLTQKDGLWEAIWDRLNKASSGYYKF